MKWFDNWFQKKSKQAWENSRKAGQPEEPTLSHPWPVNHLVDSVPTRFSTQGFTFTIYPAIGGTVVEYRTYNASKDRSDSKLHAIPTDSNLGEEITKIVTYECLRS